MRSETYRRLVAALPCVHCGIEGLSQAAHANGLEYGKGAGIKASDDAIFPLCADSPGVRGCHSLFDQGALFTKAQRRDVTERWISLTRAAIEKQEAARLAAIKAKYPALALDADRCACGVRRCECFDRLTSENMRLRSALRALLEPPNGLAQGPAR